MLLFTTIPSGVLLFARMLLSSDGTSVTQTDSFTEATEFALVADLFIESPTRVQALLNGSFNSATL